MDRPDPAPNGLRRGVELHAVCAQSFVLGDDIRHLEAHVRDSMIALRAHCYRWTRRWRPVFEQFNTGVSKLEYEPSGGRVAESRDVVIGNVANVPVEFEQLLKSELFAVERR